MTSGLGQGRRLQCRSDSVRFQRDFCRCGKTAGTLKSDPTCGEVRSDRPYSITSLAKTSSVGVVVEDCCPHEKSNRLAIESRNTGHRCGRDDQMGNPPEEVF